MKKPIYTNNKFSLFVSEWEDRSEKYDNKQSLIFPKNTYSPWLEDDFLNYFKIEVKEYTLKDIYRCYELFKLSKQILHLNGNIIEVGVWRGGSAKILEKNLGHGNSLYLCDTFSGVVKAGVNDKVYKGGEHADTNLEEVKRMFHHNENVRILQGIFPEQTSHLIDNNCIKLCHIDVDVHDSAKDIFEWVFPKLIIGGVVIFDDYGFAACEGVTTYVNSLTEYSKYRIIYNLNGHALVIKVN